MRIEDKLTVWPLKSGGIGQLLHLGVLKDYRWPSPEPFRTDEYYSLVYLVEGACRYTYMDQPARPQRTMSSGDLFILYPGVPHFYAPLPGAPWSQVYLSIQGPVFDLWRDRGILDPTRHVFHLEPIDYWLGRIETVIEAFPPEDGTNLLGVATLQMLLAEILSHAEDLKPSTDESRWLHHARSAIEAVGRADALDLNDIADQLNTSYANFRKKFTRLAKITPGKFHATALMRRACQIMHERKITDSELAETLGYIDPFRFSQRFRDIIGVTPRQFRNSVAGRK